MKAHSGRLLLWAGAFLLLLSATSWIDLANRVLAQERPASAGLHGFELLTPAAGWVWHGDDLDWSDDGGATWRRITPGDSLRYQLAGVHFANPAAGWALLLPRAAPMENALPLLLARTGDAGFTWQFAALPEDIAQQLTTAKALYLDPLGPGQGWIAANLSTSSNFSRGTLWYTEDGGATWQERTLPLGEAVQFAGSQTGWVAGGPRGDALWRTQDGGVTWNEQMLPHTPAAGEHIQVSTPLVAEDGRQIVLPVLVRSENGQVVEWFVSTNKGDSWEFAQRLSTASAQESSLTETDSRTWLLVRAGSIVPPVQPLPYFVNTQLENGRSLVQVKMATAVNGWAITEDAGHSPELLVTHDGGQTWQTVTIPVVSLQPSDAAMNRPQNLRAASAWETVARTNTVRGAGFDICDLPTLTELATWYKASPYRIVNLYLGGILRFCDNENLTASTISKLSAQGWTFIPTWVGPQAPCSVYRSRFSSNPVEAYNQGAAEAEAALAVAKSLALSEADGSGTIIYYDMESFDSLDQSCIAAAQAFVSGWTSRLHERGSQAGLYGSACSPRIDHYASGAAPPDAVWVAQWNRAAFDPQMSVWGIACLDDSLWARSQRIRQYTGGHDETWGSVTLNIDSNVVDSLVADLDATPPTPTPTITPTPTPTPQPTVLLETPTLKPNYEDGMCGSGWHMLVNQRGYGAYLAANRDRNGTIPPATAALQASWQPTFAVDGFYRVEAYIPGHPSLRWLCPEAELPDDTSTAYYSVRHADGKTIKKASQAALSDGWLLLGIYPFRAGLAAEVVLDTATDEAAYTRTVAASALRVTRVANTPAGSQFLYLPHITRR